MDTFPLDMKNTILKLKSDEIGWIKYCLIRIASDHPATTKKEEKFLWKLLEKIEKQENKKDDIQRVAI